MHILLKTRAFQSALQSFSIKECLAPGEQHQGQAAPAGAVQHLETLHLCPVLTANLLSWVNCVNFRAMLMFWVWVWGCWCVSPLQEPPPQGRSQELLKGRAESRIQEGCSVCARKLFLELRSDPCSLLQTNSHQRAAPLPTGDQDLCLPCPPVLLFASLL